MNIKPVHPHAETDALKEPEDMETRMDKQADSTGAATAPTYRDLTKELWREYDYGGRVYRIDNPQQLVIGTTTHRVVGADGVVHCVPAPGVQGCALRWQPRDATEPVQF